MSLLLLVALAAVVHYECARHQLIGEPRGEARDPRSVPCRVVDIDQRGVLREAVVERIRALKGGELAGQSVRPLQRSARRPM